MNRRVLAAIVLFTTGVPGAEIEFVDACATVFRRRHGHHST